MRCPVEVNLDWTAEVSSFLMGFLKNNYVAYTLFLGQTHFGKNYLWGYVFLKSIVL